MSGCEVGVLNGELHVHEADHLQGLRHFAGLTADFVDQRRGEAVGRERARAVARVDARLLDVTPSRRPRLTTPRRPRPRRRRVRSSSKNRSRRTGYSDETLTASCIYLVRRSGVCTMSIARPPST